LVGVSRCRGDGEGPEERLVNGTGDGECGERQIGEAVEKRQGDRRRCAVVEW
jgi:hypothetical protein